VVGGSKGVRQLRGVLWGWYPVCGTTGFVYGCMGVSEWGL